MATIKSYTDLQQSKKLAEFLPLESADMYWWSSGKRYYIESIDDDDYEEDKDIRAWSLAALLGVLPDDCGIDKENGKYVASYLVSDECGTYTSDNPVDACVSMIEYLHKLNLL